MNINEISLFDLGYALTCREHVRHVKLKVCSHAHLENSIVFAADNVIDSVVFDVRNLRRRWPDNNACDIDTFHIFKESPEGVEPQAGVCIEREQRV